MPTRRCSAGRDIRLDDLPDAIVRGALGRQRASAVRRVHERHDRTAEGRGARARRVHGEGRRGGRVPDRPAAGRAPVLAHRHRLDHGSVGDRRHARGRRDAAAVRRRARLSRARPALGVRRAAPGERARRVADVDPRADGARRRAGARARPLVAAHPRVDRRTVERGAVALVLRRRRRRPLPGHQHLGRHRGRRVLPVAARRASRCRRARSAGPRWVWRSTCSTTRAIRCAARSASSCARSRGRA